MTDEPLTSEQFADLLEEVVAKVCQEFVGCGHLSRDDAMDAVGQVGARLTYVGAEWKPADAIRDSLAACLAFAGEIGGVHNLDAAGAYVRDALPGVLAEVAK